jgi:hypothetical protein
MKKLPFVSLLLFSSTLLSQQEQQMPRHMSHDSSISLSGTRTIGYSSIDFDNLNDRLKSMPAYESLPAGMGILGLASTHKIGHFVSQGGLSVGYGRNRDDDKKRSTAVGMLGVNMDLGYNFFKPTSRVEIFPTAGLGFEGYKAWLKKDVSAVNFNDVLTIPTVQNNTESITLTNCFLTYRFGMNVGFSSPNKMFTIGLQGGYTASFKDNEWKINNDQVLQNAPSDKMSRFYGNLYMSKRINWKNKMMGMHHM